jgi:hypothetical protein
MTVSSGTGDAVGTPIVQDDVAIQDDVAGGGERPQSGASAVSELVGRLHRLEDRPLPDQVALLDAVRRGLDEALARPAPGG